MPCGDAEHYEVMQNLLGWLVWLLPCGDSTQVTQNLLGTQLEAVIQTDALGPRVCLLSTLRKFYTSLCRLTSCGWNLTGREQ